VAETRTRPAESQPRKWAQARPARPAEQLGPSRSGCPTAEHHPAAWGSQPAEPATGDNDPLKAQPGSRPTGDPPQAPQPLPESAGRSRQPPCSSAHASTPPTERHSRGSGQTERGNAYPATAWRPPIACAEVLAHPRCRGRRARARRGCWIGMLRPCPNAYLPRNHDQSQGPSLPTPLAGRQSSLLRPIGLPLPSARLHHRLIRTVFADEAGQTGLPCSAIRPCARATPNTPQGPAAPDPEPGLADMAFTVT
jgi:hypothetical protein